MSLLDTHTPPPAWPGAGLGRLGAALRMHRAALRARELYPGPVGETLCNEIMSWADFGHRLGGRSRIAALVDELMKTPLPAPEGAVRSSGLTIS